MREHSREVVRNVREMSQRFLSLTGWMGMLSGAATGFGFLGFNALANNAANMRQQAAQQFTTIGGMQAARIGMGRFGNVPNMLSTLGAAAQTPGSEGWQALLNLQSQARAVGKGFEFRAGEDAESLLEKVAPALQAVMQGIRPELRGTLFEKFKFGQLGFGGFAEAQPLIRATPEEVQTQVRQTQQLRGGFEVPGARAFQDFTTAIETATATIKTTLINQIVALAGPLGDLSKQVTALLQSFIRWALSKDNIDALAKGIKDFADFLRTHDFATDWQTFKTALTEAADAIKSFVEFVKGVVPTKEAVRTPDPLAGSTEERKEGWQALHDKIDEGLRWLGGKLPKLDIPGQPGDDRPRPSSNPLSRWLHPSSFQTGGGQGIPIVAARTLPVEIVGFGRFEEKAKEEQPPQPQSPFGNMLQFASFRPGGDNDNMTGGDLLSRIAKVESNFNPLAVSKSGAQGLMQFMPETWKRFGHGSPFDPIEAIRAAQRYLSYLFSLKELGGDPAKVVASYNAGEGAVIDSIKRFGRDWLSHLSPETQQYVPMVLGQPQGGRPDFHPPSRQQTAFVLQNEAGGNLVVATRQIAV